MWCAVGSLAAGCGFLIILSMIRRRAALKKAQARLAAQRGGAAAGTVVGGAAQPLLGGGAAAINTTGTAAQPPVPTPYGTAAYTSAVVAPPTCGNSGPTFDHANPVETIVDDESDDEQV